MKSARKPKRSDSDDSAINQPFLFEVLAEGKLCERDQIHPVVQIDVTGVGQDVRYQR